MMFVPRKELFEEAHAAAGEDVPPSFCRIGRSWAKNRCGSAKNQGVTVAEVCAWFELMKTHVKDESDRPGFDSIVLAIASTLFFRSNERIRSSQNENRLAFFMKNHYLASVVLTVWAANAQGAAFHNLDFEAARLPPPGETYAPITSAMPGWQAFMGGDPQTNVLYDGASLGTAFIGLGRASEGFPVLRGDFSAWLNPGANPFDLSQNVGVTISQMGTIPMDAHSLFFLAQIGTFHPELDIFGVFVDDQRLPVVPGPSSGSFLADIAPFAGQDVTLKFTCFNLGPLGPTSMVLDSIAFMPVPEPSGLALLALSGALGWLCWRRTRPNP